MIQLYIDNLECDIDKSVGLYLNKKFESTDNPTLYHSEYSKTITLPMTGRNKRIFYNYQRTDSVVTTEATIDPRMKTPFFLLYNGQKVMEGYVKLNNANTCIDDKVFEVELKGSFGLIMNELSQFTFNKYECASWGGTKPDEYLITGPFSSDLTVNASLVKQSFEQENHNLDGTDILDYIKFIPSYQGQYPDFESDKEQVLIDQDHELSQERDEHYMREFRSYYQQPAIWCDKLWKMAKEKLEEITDYTMNLDPSWFNTYNPYWTKMVYTCPNLYNPDDNFIENTSNFNADSLHHKLNITQMSGLSNHHTSWLHFTTDNDVMYRNGIFNPDLKGPSKFTMNSSIMFLAKRMWDGSSKYARVRKVNPLFVVFSVINADTGDEVDKYRYMIYTNSAKAEFNSWFDEKIDVGVTNTLNPNILGDYPMGFSRQAGYWWEAPINVSFDVTQNIRYRVQIDIYFANNSKAVAYSDYSSLSSMWNLWFYQTQLPNGSGYTVFNYLRSGSCSTLDYTRSRSKIDLYRVFPKKDVTLMSVLLNYSRMFGLLWDVDQDNKTITVMTRNRFFHNFNIIDWTDKIDKGKDFVVNPICFDKKYVCFNVEEGEGHRYKNYYDRYGVGYGSKKIDTEYGFNSESEDLLKDIQPAIITQKAQFSRITNTENPDEPNFIGYNAKIYPDEHYLENDDEGENAENSGAFVFVNGTMKPDPRLGFKTGHNEGIVLVTDDTDYMKHKDSYMWNLSFLNTEICRKLPDVSTISGGYSVHFESPAEYYFRGSFSNVKYLYDLFWRNYIDERYSVNNKKLTCYVYLTQKEYADIRFRDFVKIGNVLYHINQIIDYDFDTNSPTKVILVQVWDTAKYTDGQHTWPILSATPNSVEVRRDEDTVIDVYSSSEWVVDSKPGWIAVSNTEEVRVRDTLVIHATSIPLRARSGHIVLKTTTNPILTEIVDVWQIPENAHIILNNYGNTVTGDGTTFTVSIDSSPSDVTVQSKPSWVDVEITHRAVINYSLSGEHTVKDVRDITKKADITKAVNIVAVFRVNENYRPLKRSGNIVFTNGYNTATFSLTQLGKAIIAEDYDLEPINIDINELAVWDLTTNKQIDPATAEITYGTVTQPNKSISYLPVSFQPALDPTDYGDNCIETCTGGQLVFLREDGKAIVKNYNYGDVAEQYEIIINPNDGGHFTVDDVPWYEQFRQVVDAGTVLEVEAVPDEGYVFTKWDDDVMTAQRTITVDADIEIQPIFTPVESDGSVLYDDYVETQYDNKENIKY